jgi:hypothetical protein
MPTSSTYVALTREIEEFRQQFEHLIADGEVLTAPLRDDQFVWQPAPDAWCIAQCFEHLNVSARLYLPQLDEGVADAIRRGLYAEGPFTYNWIGRWMPRLMEPPPRFRYQTPKAFQPSSNRARYEIMAGFRAYQVQYIDRLRQASGLDLARARVASPVSGWIRMPLGSAFALIAAHERRHLWQARQIVALPGFPP